MEQSRIDLTQAEWQVMECLWDQAPRTGREPPNTWPGAPAGAGPLP